MYVGVLFDLSPASLFYNIPQCVHVKPQACKNSSKVLSFIRCVFVWTVQEMASDLNRLSNEFNVKDQSKTGFARAVKHFFFRYYCYFFAFAFYTML